MHKQNMIMYKKDYKKVYSSDFPKYTGNFDEDYKEFKIWYNEQQRIKGLRERDIDNLIKTLETVGSPPNERKRFKVGESVVISFGGFISAVIVKEIVDGVYEVDITSRPYNKPYEKVSNRVYGWWSIFKLEKEESPVMLGEKTRIQFHQTTVESLLHRYFNNRGVDMNPTYQRGIVWTEEQRISLLDSVFSYLDIGKFVFVELPYVTGGYHLEILDGKQKLATLVDFYSDKFTYNGYYYSQLPFEMKCVFKNLIVSVGKMQDRDYNLDSVLKYFVKLNTSGTPMDKEHLNNIKKQINNK